jgi:hypothetical protein
MQLAVVAQNDAHAEGAESEDAAYLRALSRSLAGEATILSAKVCSLGPALEMVLEQYRAEVSAAQCRDSAALRVYDFIDPAGGTPRTIIGPRSSVGPYKTATSRRGAFACLDLRGYPIAARGRPDPWSSEWSAERAAALFVDTEGPDVAMGLVLAAEERAEADIARLFAEQTS